MKSPRKRFQVVLPDQPSPGIGASAAQLALLVVAVNIVACLIAGRAMTNAGVEQAGVLALERAGSHRGQPAIGARAADARLAPFTLDARGRQ